MSATESATQVLQAMLDERGVEHFGDEHHTYWYTTWAGKDSIFANVSEYPEGKLMLYWRVTPEQAIAATLGAGTCHDTRESRWFHCSECGFGMNDLYTDSGWSEEEQPKFCPNCGRRVVEVDE